MQAKILVAALLGCVSLAAAGEVISHSAVVSQNGKPIGKIQVLTPVEVVSKNAAPVKVMVKGVVSENYPLQIQKSMQNGEIYVVFDTENVANFTKGKKLEDDYGEIWYEATGVYEVAADAVAADVRPLYAKAKELYELTCSACHRLHEPNSFTANQWPANLQGMIDAGYVAMEEADLELITKYLQQHSK